MIETGTVMLVRDIDEENARQDALVALERELTPRLHRSLLAYARRRERWLVVNGVRSAIGEAAAFLADAISDTAIGAVVCPAGVSMSTHLRAVIRGRTARLMDRGLAAPHASVDDPDTGAATRRELIQVMGTVPDASTAYSAAEQTGRVVEYLSVVAAGDPGVLALLGAYRAGAWEVAEVILATGMTPAEASAARKRMDRMLARMPDAGDERALSDSGTW